MPHLLNSGPASIRVNTHYAQHHQHLVCRVPLEPVLTNSCDVYHVHMLLRYCSHGCFSGHWSQHRPVCRQLQGAVAQVAEEDTAPVG